MDVHIKTRGEGANEEYDFLGGEPEAEWWSAFRELVDWNGTGVGVRSRAGTWWLYLTAIPSVRRDRQQRICEFKLAFSGGCGEPEVTDTVLPLLGLWLAEVAEPSGAVRLRDAFDEAFPAEAVTRLRGRHSTEHRDETVRRFNEAVQLLDLGVSADGPSDEVPTNHVWWGRRNDPEDRRFFWGRVARLLAGTEEGAAVLANLVYASDAEGGDLAQSTPVRRLRDAAPEDTPGTLYYSLLLRPEQRPQRPEQQPEQRPADGEVMAKKAVTAPVQPPAPSSPEPGTQDFLRRLTWGCAALVVILAGVVVLAVMALA